MGVGSKLPGRYAAKRRAPGRLLSMGCLVSEPGPAPRPASCSSWRPARLAAAAAVRPVFSAIGRKTVWLGEAGQGGRMKLVANAYLSILIEGVAEALELAGRLDIDDAKLAEAIEGGPLDAPIADAKLHKMG